LVRTLTALALATAFVVPLAAPAMAQPHGRPGERQDSWQGRPGPQHYGRPGPQHYERQRYERHDNWRGGGRDNSGALIGGALLGLGVGAIIGGAMVSQPPAYYAPPPAYYAPLPEDMPPPPPPPPPPVQGCVGWNGRWVSANTCR